MSKQVRLNDLDYYSQRTDENGPAMTYSMEVISRLELGQYNKAVEVFPRAYANYQVSVPLVFHCQVLISLGSFWRLD